MEEINLVELIYYNDGTPKRKAIYDGYANYDEALAAYHAEMGKWMKAQNVRKIQILIVGEVGVFKDDWWERPPYMAEVTNDE